MNIPPGIFLCLAILALLAPLAAFILGSWVLYAGRTAKNPLPVGTLFRRKDQQQPDPQRPKPPLLQP